MNSAAPLFQTSAALWSALDVAVVGLPVLGMVLLGAAFMLQNVSERRLADENVEGAEDAKHIASAQVHGAGVLLVLFVLAAMARSLWGPS